MEITVAQEKGKIPVAVISLSGQLDGQNFHELIAKARELYQAGTKDVLLDLSNLTYVSSAGLVALHTVALLLRGEQLPDPEHGWAALKSMESSRVSGPQEHIKLLNPQPEVLSVLEMVGFTAFFPVFTDRQQAVQSF